MRIGKITFTAQTSFALGFGLAAAVLFWWEASEPIWSSSWTGSAEQWLALANLCPKSRELRERSASRPKFASHFPFAFSSNRAHAHLRWKARGPHRAFR